MLPKTIQERFNLINISEFTKTPYARLWSAFSKDLQCDVVVKIAKSKKDSLREALALKAFDGKGCVKLLGYLKNDGATLLEKISPGTPLSALFPAHDEKATLEFSLLLKKLHRKKKDTANIHSLSEWLLILNKQSKTVEHLRVKAQRIANQLLQNRDEPVFLHGDLHHDNILLDNIHGYIAIDPKGIVGSAEYEVAPFLCNPINSIHQRKDLLDILKKRIEVITRELGIEADRIKGWTYVHAVMACLWAEEDGLYDSLFFWLAQFLEDNSFVA